MAGFQNFPLTTLLGSCIPGLCVRISVIESSCPLTVRRVTGLIIREDPKTVGDYIANYISKRSVAVPQYDNLVARTDC